ncbi:MAG TPA: hypothetical protein VM889_11145 [Candidatus Thermoplasmatota archaeon]|nr:hypothetical protein [Candidatus Thermoplasmatota archaeon]
MTAAPPAPPTLVALLNEEAALSRGLAAAASPDRARARALDAMRSRVAFPFRAVFKAVVVGERILASGPLAVGEAGQRRMKMQPDQRYLEVAPEGLTPIAFEILGPILVPSARNLMEGSVIMAALDVLDPSRYPIEGPGLVADLLDLKVLVAVEP